VGKIVCEIEEGHVAESRGLAVQVWVAMVGRVESACEGMC
jgi:hypothetical protein